MLLTKQEAARALRISETGIWRLERAGGISPVRIGKSTRYRAEDIERLAREGFPGPLPRSQRESA